ncbi:hypothetical protein PRIPAC_84492 [Pristionchus pacificus]|uniref:Peptidase n=1 Tax=Pristionchus pacificus TaxID=54126 RepID=A0A2A6CEE7_PRIPA|nr:hypothetical protein PRIPAC_84492 [Pristionchus pacificus]|eukprot:PDM76499.1 Peptidase [Pristionchus pacificus]
MITLSFIFLLVLIINLSVSSSPDDSLPVYMRGMQWHKVQEHLKTDLSLSGAVIPISYAIELSVNVRGHARAVKSDFNGTVIIELDLNRAVDNIELHLMGLTIEKAELIDNVIMNEPVEISNISANTERESITIHANRTIELHEKFMLKISYRGLAIMDEYGLYENWDPKHNISADSNGPYILASNNFPTGARYWFPCFDEPDKKATFELRVSHPAGLNVYSNTEVKRTESVNEGRTLTIFEKTRPLPTYHVALSVNHLYKQVLEVKGFGSVRLVISNNSNGYAVSRALASLRWFDKERYAFDVPGFIKRNLESLQQTIFEIPKEKLDIIILEGSNAYTVQPGLITIGRLNLILFGNGRELTHDFRNMTQLLIGNRITVRKHEQIWINDMFSYFLTNESAHVPFDSVINFAPDQILRSSLHEKPLRYKLIFSTSTSQYLTSKNPVPSLKAAQIQKLLERYCPSSKNALKIYINAHVGEFASIDDLISTMANACANPEIAREFLEDYIDQPGKPLLIVKRNNNTVVITQTRYHSTYFNSQLRDNKTRYTLPILYTIDVSSISIEVPHNAIFLIEHEFDHLYFAYYQDIINPHKNITQEEKKGIFTAVRKSMLAALSIGFITYGRFQNQWMLYDLHQIAYDHALLFFKVQSLVIAPRNYTYGEDTPRDGCNISNVPTWNELANDNEWYWDFNGALMFSEKLHCTSQWHNTSTFMRFLEENFIGSNTTLRPSLMAHLPEKHFYYGQWKGLHRFFFRNAGKYSNHSRFTMLAETILKQDKAGAIQEIYPDMNNRDDYINELRDFVIHNPQKAASMSTEIEMRMEREYIKREMPLLNNVTKDQMWYDFQALGKDPSNTN